MNGSGGIHPSNGRAYYLIRRSNQQDRPLFQVWKRISGKDRALLISEYRSLASAKACLPVAWVDTASSDIEAWGFWAEDLIMDDTPAFSLDARD